MWGFLVFVYQAETNRIAQLNSLFPVTSSAYLPEDLQSAFAQNGSGELAMSIFQHSEHSGITGVLSSNLNGSDQGPQKQQSTSRAQKSRRRDYTKAEKESFERWIVENPKPNHGQKADFAMKHDLTDHQVQNLINNRRRKLKSMEKKNEISVINADDSASSYGKPPSNFLC